MSTAQFAATEFHLRETAPHFSPWCFSRTKRALDVFLSGLLLIVLAPVMVVVAILVKVSSRGPAIFKQLRVGRDGRLFTIYKFRTMYSETVDGSGLTCDSDPRITPVGSFLRYWKLDELPQLFNVLAGQMSMVGPRPDLPEFISCLPKDLRIVLSLKPGISSMASVKYRNERFELGSGSESQIWRTYVEQMLPDKVRIDIHYAQDASASSDLAVLFRTALAILG